ncbi:MAG: L-threonine 3-dehydrogenase [Bacteroidales bacterium]|nr:L-threonine 3-dehydrogenase [Bacteroidales bacterium]
MKALVKAKAERGLWMQDVPVPTIGPDDVLIKIRKTAICGTDLHIYRWDEWSQKTIKTPMTIGHEYVGEIAELGANVKNMFTIGERVTGEGHIACGVCRNCRRGWAHICENTYGVGVHRDGCFAEYLSLPATNVVRINEKIEDELCSIMDPYGNATHTALSFNLLGEDVIITGAGGPIGAMCVAIAKFAGARNVFAVEPNEYRLELARTMGADFCVNPLKEDLKTVLEKNNLQGFDIGLECSGNGIAFNQMVSAMYNGGSIALLGILPSTSPVNWNEIIFKGLKLKGIYGREMYETWYKMEAMLLAGLNIKPVITHRYKVDEFIKGFEAMDSGSCGKVILDWQ